MTTFEIILVLNRIGGDENFNSLVKGLWGHIYWTNYWGSEIIKRLRTPGVGYRDLTASHWSLPLRMQSLSVLKSH